jgi:hypothetical protein
MMVFHSLTMVCSARPSLIRNGSLLLLLAALAFAHPHTTRAQKPLAPEVLNTASGTTEVGTIDGAPYRIDIPANWNRSLVVYYHGYALRPFTFHIAARLDGTPLPFLERRFAVIESAYSRGGWALEQAYPETEALRRYFTRRYGQPHETYVTGSSMGGDLVSITLELNPKPYLGGLDLCGAVGPTYAEMERRFALRAAFDAYFPDVMPPLVPVPITFEDTAADRDKVLSALHANPAAATMMRNLAELHTDADLAHDIPYWTFVIGDLEQRAHGNPFDNRNTIYSGTSLTGTTTDLELNQRVRRYTASPQARGYLMRHYTPNGHLGRPMLALHTLYDPVVPVRQLALYDHIVQAAGSGQNLVQQYVDREGHCNFRKEQVGDAFDELLRWTHGGPRPTPGLQK